MKPRPLFLLLVGGAIWLLGASCSTPYFLAHDFPARTSAHQRVAVLPVEVVLSGRLPADLSEEDLRAIQQAEAQAFQISFYHEILRSTKSGRKPIRVDVQQYRQTLELMNENGIGIEASFRRDPTELARLLGVDAVVKARIAKTRFLTDLESYGIEVGIRIAQILSNIQLYPWLPPQVARAKNVRADYAVLDGADGATLWSIAFDIDADWRRPANEIIDGISRRAAKRFPYRK